VSMSTIFFITSLSVVLALLAVSMYFNVKHAMIILNTQDAIERCLDIIDIQYRRMNKIVETPIFFDSVEVRSAISQIKKSHDSLLVVANTLTSGINGFDNTELESKNDD